MLNIGDKLLCHTNCIMEDDDDIATTKGKYYDIVQITTDYLTIVDDNDYNHMYSLDKDEYFYEKWFTNIKESRFKKLNKIIKNNKV